MSNMKCPICQSNLHKINIIVSTCTNDKCKLWGSSIPNLVLGALAQTKQDLEHARKALEIAVVALEDYEDRDSYDCNGNWCGCECSTAHEALEQITALEQKDK